MSLPKCSAWTSACFRAQKKSLALTSNTGQPYRTTRGRLDEAYSDEEVSVALHRCMSFAQKIAVVVDNHSLLAIRTSDIAKGNISACLLDNEPSDDDGRVSVCRLPLQGVNVDDLSLRFSGRLKWEPLDRLTDCLVLVTCVLHADGIEVAVVWVIHHNVSHVGRTMSENEVLVDDVFVRLPHFFVDLVWG